MIGPPLVLMLVKWTGYPEADKRYDASTSTLAEDTQCLCLIGGWKAEVGSLF